jgi:arylsulfatase
MSAIDFGPTLIGLIGEDYKSVEARLKGYDYSNIVKGGSAKDQRDEILVCFSNTTQGNSRLEKIRMVQKVAEKNGAPVVQFNFPDDFIQFDKRTLGRGIITSKYKYSRWFTPGDHHLPKTWQTLLGRNDLELYDLDNDPLELNNLAYHPEEQRELIIDLNDRLNKLIEKEVGVDLGSFLPGDPKTWTTEG